MIKRTSHWVLIIVIALLVIVASGVITVRMALPKANLYKQELAEYLSNKLQAQVTIGSIEALWVNANPQFKITDFSVTDNRFMNRSLAISQLQGELDIGLSVKYLAPIFKQLSVNQLSVNIEQVQGRWLTVFSQQAADSSSVPVDATIKTAQQVALNKLLAIFSSQSLIEFTDASFVLAPESRPTRRVGPVQFLMQNTDLMHQISGEAKLIHYGEKSKVKFALQAEQLADNIAETPFLAYAKFQNLSQQLLELNLIKLGLDIDKLSLDAQVWGKLQNGAVSDVRGNIAIAELAFNDSSLPKLDNSQLQFSLNSDAGEHKLQLSNISLAAADAQLEVPRASVTYVHGKENYLSQVAVSQIDLEQLSSIATAQPLLEDKLKEFVEKLHLRGRVQNLNVDWSNSKLADFSISADLNRVSAEAYKGVPAISGVSGRMQMSAKRGHIDLNSTDLNLQFPTIYSRGWHYPEARGRVAWQINYAQEQPVELLVNSELLSLSRDKMQANGRFSVVVPFDKQQQAELTLLIGLKETHVKDALSYLPGKLVGESLTTWIESAALSGRLQEAGFVLRTGIKKDLPRQQPPSVQMYFQLADAKVNFNQSWPNYDANDLHIAVHEGNLQVLSEHGSFASNQVSRLSVTKSLTETAVNVSAIVSGRIDNLQQKLQQKPANAVLPQILESWKLAGEHITALDLVVPLKINKAQRADPNEPAKGFSLKLASTIKNGELSDSQYNLNFTKIKGKLAYDLATGLQSNAMALSVFGHPGKVSIVSKAEGKALKTSVALSAAIEVSELQKWLKTDLPEQLSGTGTFDARLDWCTGQPSCNQLLVNSDLLGVGIDLPAPWGKSKKQASKLQVLSNTSDKGVLWRYNYADKIRGITRLGTTEGAASETTSILATNNRSRIIFGGARPTLPAKPGIYLGGRLVGVNLDKLLALSKNNADESLPGKTLVTSPATVPLKSQLKDIDLQLSNVTLMGRALNTGRVNIKRAPGFWRVNFNTDVASGTALIADNSRQPIVLKLDKLVLKSASEQAGKSSPISNSPRASINTRAWPNVKLSIDKFLLNNLDIGRWSAVLGPSKRGYTIKSLQGGIANTKISAEMRWDELQKNITTHLSLQADGGDFGAVLKQLGFDRVLETKTGNLQTQLSWPGYPWDIEQKNLSGTMSFKLSQGRIIEAGTSANFLRIFGILNLNTVIKRLKLDFSDLLESGVAFDTVTANYHLQNGLATSREPLKLKGSSANVEMSGTINFTDQTLQQKMLVAIPLTSNAPIAALLLATPQVAGIAFIIDKLLGKKLAKLTALRYQVSGSWLEPNIRPTNGKK